jgi:hypothetical protein
MVYGWEGYGLFWGVVEMMASSLDFKLPITPATLQSIIGHGDLDEDFIDQFLTDCVMNFKLFNRDDNNAIYYPPLMDEGERVKAAIFKQKEAGRLGGLKSAKMRRKMAIERAKKLPKMDSLFSAKKGIANDPLSTNDNELSTGSKGTLQNELSTGSKGTLQIDKNTTKKSKGTLEKSKGTLQSTFSPLSNDGFSAKNDKNCFLLPHEKKRLLSTKNGSYQHGLKGTLEKSKGTLQLSEKKESYPQGLKPIRTNNNTTTTTPKTTKNKENTHSPNPSRNYDLVCSELLKNGMGKNTNTAFKNEEPETKISDLEFLKNVIRGQEINNPTISRLMDLYFFIKPTHLKEKISSPSAWKQRVVANIDGNKASYVELATEILKSLEKTRFIENEKTRIENEAKKNKQKELDLEQQKNMIDAVIETMHIDERNNLKERALQILMRESNIQANNIMPMFVSEKMRDIVLKDLQKHMVSENA